MLQKLQNHLVGFVIITVLYQLIQSSDFVLAQNSPGGYGGTSGDGGGGGGVNSGGVVVSGNVNGENSDNNDNGVGEVMGPKTGLFNSQEPSCEELRAMWRFSKRQSRAAEITNEIPTYRDPFVYNIWDPYYPTTRSMGGMRPSVRFRDSLRPVYGRILHREPMVQFRDYNDRTRGFDDMNRIYGSENKVIDAQPRRRVVQFRFSGSNGGPGGISATNIANGNNGMNAGRFNDGIINGGGVSGGGSGGGGNGAANIRTNEGQNIGGAAQNSLTPQRGSFQRLKELIWTERAKELAQQRRAEEMAARAAVLKQIANGQRNPAVTGSAQQDIGQQNQRPLRLW